MPIPSKVIKQSKPAQAATSRYGPPDTPPETPTAQLNPLEFAKQVIDTVKLIQSSESKETLPVAGSQAEPKAQGREPLARASRLEIKEVHEIWDSKTCGYKVVESPQTSELTELDSYIFVVRTRIDKTTPKATVYIDIKSEGLRDVLRNMLKDITWISLSGDKPAVEQNLLFHYLLELEAYRADRAVDAVFNGKSFEALDLLINTIKKRYKSTTERLLPLLKEGKVTYDFLWALFKANDHVISTCPGSGKPRCLRYNMGEEKTTHQGVEYFELQCQYLDFDGKLFGTVVERLRIEKFRGARQINTLNIFPVKFHPSSDVMIETLTARGRSFVGLVGSHHRQYDGHAFYQRKDGLVRMSVKSRIVIDAENFRKSNPSYPRLFTQSSGSSVDMCFGLSSGTDQADSQRVKSKVTLCDISKNDLLICSPTVLAFSLNDKFWGEYAVDDIIPIDWSTSPFDCLTIPATKKEVIMAVAQNHLGRSCEKGRSVSTADAFDDVVEGKGRGINILLHGPPGVGKTLTAEALSEYFHRPLYSISTGELSSDAEVLERQLTHIFQTAHAWNALLLLDEADVFLQRRAELTLDRNRLVAVFLRKLEYYDGVLFLTTNLDKLERDARKTIITRFLQRLHSGRRLLETGAEYVDRFACVPLNGRQVKNTISIAIALANAKDEAFSSSHISQALAASGNLIPESSDILDDESLYD